MQQQRYESNEKRATLEGTFQEYLCIHFFFVIYPPIFHSGHVFIYQKSYGAAKDTSERVPDKGK